MSPRRSLGALLVTLLFAAGCGAGSGAETDKEQATPYLAGFELGPVSVHAVRIVLASSTSDTTTPSGTGPQAYLSATLVNNGGASDTLVAATIAGGAVQSADGGNVNIELPSTQIVQLGEPDLGLTGPAIGVGALSTPLRVGTTETVTFTFQNAGTEALQVPVVEASAVGTTASAAPVSAAG